MKNVLEIQLGKGEIKLLTFLFKNKTIFKFSFCLNTFEFGILLYSEEQEFDKSFEWLKDSSFRQN